MASMKCEKMEVVTQPLFYLVLLKKGRIAGFCGTFKEIDHQNFVANWLAIIRSGFRTDAH